MEPIKYQITKEGKRLAHSEAFSVMVFDHSEKMLSRGTPNVVITAVILKTIAWTLTGHAMYTMPTSEEEYGALTDFVDAHHDEMDEVMKFHIAHREHILYISE